MKPGWREERPHCKAYGWPWSCGLGFWSRSFSCLRRVVGPWTQVVLLFVTDPDKQVRNEQLMTPQSTVVLFPPPAVLPCSCCAPLLYLCSSFICAPLFLLCSHCPVVFPSCSNAPFPLCSLPAVLPSHSAPTRRLCSTLLLCSLPSPVLLCSCCVPTFLLCSPLLAMLPFSHCASSHCASSRCAPTILLCSPLAVLSYILLPSLLLCFHPPAVLPPC